MSDKNSLKTAFELFRSHSLCLRCVETVRAERIYVCASRYACASLKRAVMVGHYLLNSQVTQKAVTPDRPVRAQLRHTVPRTTFSNTILSIMEL